MAIPGWKDSINPSWVNMKLSGGQPMDNPDFKGNYEKYKYLGAKNNDFVFFDDPIQLRAAENQNYKITNLEERRTKIADQTRKNETQLEINKVVAERDKVWQENVDKLKNSLLSPADSAPRIRKDQKVSGTKAKRYSAASDNSQFNSLLTIKNLLGE